MPLLFPILGALGALGGGAAGIAKAVNDAKANESQLEELKRHNLVIENKAKGKGFYLAPFKKKIQIDLPKHALDNIELKKYPKKIKLQHFRGVFMKDTLPKINRKRKLFL